jgi:tetratricopeptide (TPR) repeat protein
VDETPPDTDALWDHEDPEGSEAAVRALLERARSAAGRGAYVAELLSQLARVLGIQGRLSEAHQALDEAETRAGTGPEAERARLRTRLERGRLHAQAGDPATARTCFLEAWELGRASGEDFHAIDAAHMLAIVDQDESLMWGDRALRFTEASARADAKRWLGTLHHNLGVRYLELGDPGPAARHLRLAIVDYEARGDRPGIRTARCYLGRALRLLGCPTEALAMLLAEIEATDLNLFDGLVLAEIGECLLALDRTADARPYFARAHRLLSRERGGAKWDRDWLRRLAELGQSTPGSPGP